MNLLTGISRYCNIYHHNNDLAEALQMAAHAADEHNALIAIRGELAHFAFRAAMATSKHRTETNYARDMVNTLEEREFLQQMVSFGVGYTQSRLWYSKAAISDMHTLRRYVSRACSLQEHSDVGSITQEAQKHIRNGDNGYYLLDLHKGCILVRGQYPIEDIIIDLAASKNPDSSDHILIRWRKGNCFPDTRFLIAPNGVYFLGHLWPRIIAKWQKGPTHQKS